LSTERYNLCGELMSYLAADRLRIVTAETDCCSQLARIN